MSSKWAIFKGLEKIEFLHNDICLLLNMFKTSFWFIIVFFTFLFYVVRNNGSTRVVFGTKLRTKFKPEF